MIAEGVQTALRQDGFGVDWVGDGAAASDALRASSFDLVLLDLGLPRRDGLAVLRELRERHDQTPLIVLTARDEVRDRVAALDAGADDYLVKPFRLAELLARIRALDRRRNPDRADTPILSVGDISVDTDARRVAVDGAEVELRPKEFDLLVVLMNNAGKALSREFLMAEVWDEHYFGSTKTLDVHIAALRRRLGESGPEGSRISTLRGVGYRLELPEPTEPTR